ncbi:hypothetical protein CWS02_15015 [Enterobacter sp. EA-1]|nr:hypothetical protein CWS02_15015 [Enterobacter sp. EA-1]
MRALREVISPPFGAVFFKAQSIKRHNKSINTLTCLQVSNVGTQHHFVFKEKVMTTHRSEKDSMGAIDVPADKLWGAQTQRSLEHFRISTEKCRSR